MEDEPNAERSDAELIAAARSGDVDAFDELYRRYRDWVVRLAARWTGSPHDSADVLQDCFLYVLRKLPELELRARFSTFLYPVVRHLSLARRRRGGREVASEHAPDPPDRSEPVASREELAHAMAALPPEQREVVMLRFVDDLSLAEVADALRIPIGTVKSRLHQALRVLREDPRTRRYFLP